MDKNSISSISVGDQQILESNGRLSEINLDVLIFEEDQNKEPEFFSNIRTCQSSEGVQLSSVINSLKEKKYEFKDCIIQYITKDGFNVNCWSDPIPECIYISQTDLQQSPNNINDRIHLSIKKIIYEDEKSDTSNDGEEPNKPQRAKERCIEEVQEKVKQWIQQRDKMRDENPNMKRVAENAAKLVGIPKKSLDDYLHQLKMGAVNHFDFNTNKHEKIGVLRQYNKKKLSIARTKEKRNKL